MRERYQLQSLTSFQAINKSQTNRSKSKQTYSFSKSQRFQNYQSVCKKQSYQGDILKTKNSGYSIGKNKRSDFTKSLSVAPGVSKYDLKSIFDKNQSQQKGVKMSLGREKVYFGSYLNKQLIAIPSPNKYNIQKKSRVNSPAYSLRSKTKMLDRTNTIQCQNDNPGPGHYQNPELNYNSKYSSKFSTIGYSNSKSKRFQDYNSKTPGPGNYKDYSMISNVGRYVLSQHTGGTKAIFDQSKRVTKFDQIKKNVSVNPGPGTYRAASQFGYYDGDLLLNPSMNISRSSRRMISTRNN